MNNKSKLKNSLARKFVYLMTVFLACFMIGSLLLLIAQYILNESYITKRNHLRGKQEIAVEMNSVLTQALFDVRGYLAYGNPALRDNALSEEPQLKQLEAKFEKVATTENDQQFLNAMKEFRQYYFHETLPRVIEEYQAGNNEEVAHIANSHGTAKVIEIRSFMSDYLQSLNQAIESNYQTLIKSKNYVQIGFILFILVILLMLLRIIRIMLRKIGQPLTQFAAAAEKIANGDKAVFKVEHQREDEIGALSSAFQKMAEKVQEKEQALKARNEELNTLLHKSEEERKRNQDIFNSLHEGVQLIDSQGATIQINNQFGELINCHDQQIVGMNMEQWTNFMAVLVEEEDFMTNMRTVPVNKQNSGNKDHSFIYTLKNPRRVIKVYSEVLFHGEEMIGMVLVHRDTTKEYEVDQMKSEFVSTVSHELRTPLASILGFTELMLQRELKPDRREKYLTTILNEAKRLTALINDFLDIQRLESGKQAYEKRYVELLPILEKVMEGQQVNTKQHTILLEPDGDELTILGDKSKLEQVFTNLISNAIKYTPQGGNIKIRSYQEAGLVKVAVIDHGLGIPVDSIDKLFTKFYRVDNSDRRKIGGTGLGLAIVQEIVKAHDGEITIDSIYGKGSTFTAMFPAVQVNLPVAEAEKFKEPASGFKILVVEDDQSLAELISQELWDSGFAVICYKNGPDTLEYLEQEIPDAIVLDILLDDPEFDGWRIMREIKQSERLKNIPIIVSTALDEKEKGMSLGAMDFLIKPYKPSQLSKAIMQTLLKIGKVGQILIPEKFDG